MVRAALLCGIACVGLCADQSFAAVRIHLVDGRAIDGLSYRIESSFVFLQVGQDDSVRFPSSRVASFEPLEEPMPAPLTQAPVEPPVVAPLPPAMVSSGPPPSSPPDTAMGPSEGPANIDTLIRRAAERHQLDPDLLAAVIAVESGYRTHALSPKGAQGLMQLMPATARDLAVKDPFDAEQNIEAGARYLKQLLDQHGDSFVDALAAYNAGMGRVARYKGIPPYHETVRYIERVLKTYASGSRPGPSTADPGK